MDEDDISSTYAIACDVPPVGIVDLDPVHWTPQAAGKYTITLSLRHDGQEAVRNVYTLVVEEES